MIYDCKEAQDFFERVGQSETERICELISEMAYDEDIKSDEIYISDRDQIDVINVLFSGILTWGNEEFYFSGEVGNMSGFVLNDFGQEIKPFERRKPNTLSLKPIVFPDNKKEAGFLLSKWDALLQREDMRDLVKDYSYDKFFAPGLKTNNHYKNKAASYGFEIVTSEEAKSTRERIEAIAGRGKRND